ncbi:FixH family protein [Pedobacter sp. MC2016-05]|uniref:FixH family protein n=1 Tax=Pedobacter sp. MC2016-05 TaxID=2994474 RepID=UPI00224589AC|nr:FixH family protein [Pedobacter sp. MC2016-05]MCX2477230.1 FixH family protein [Pedobacter sp. MC2016-05]
MKLKPRNWGAKLAFVMVIFILFIMGMVTYMFMVHGRDSLVDEDYYEKGLDYTKEYNSKANVIRDHEAPVVKVTSSQIIIELKNKATYSMRIMRPADQKSDQNRKGETDGADNKIVVEQLGMAKGLWILNLNWSSNGKTYAYEKNIIL